MNSHTATAFVYPRTAHLPWSPGREGDGIYIRSLNTLRVLRDVVVTEKMDGFNVALSSAGLQVRGLDYTAFQGRNWIRSFHKSIAGAIPPGLLICGEDLHASNKIFYADLPAHFLVFSIYHGDTCLSWDETQRCCAGLNLRTVPQLYRGAWDEERVKACWTSKSYCGGAQEGYVVRDAGAFRMQEFQERVAKFVRFGHGVMDEAGLARNPPVNGLNSLL